MRVYTDNYDRYLWSSGPPQIAIIASQPNPTPSTIPSPHLLVARRQAKINAASGQSNTLAKKEMITSGPTPDFS